MKSSTPGFIPPSSSGRSAAPYFLGALVLLALIVRLSFFSGIEYSDDLNYSYDGWKISTGIFKPGFDGWGVRLGLIAPIGVCFTLFGVHTWSLMLYPLLCSLGLVIVIFLLGRMFFNESTGLLASFLMALYPLDVEYATKAMPDVPIAFWMALGVLLFFKAYNARPQAQGRRGGRWAGFFASGLMFACAYLVRDTGLLMVVLIGIFLFLDLIMNTSRGTLKEAIPGKILIYAAVIAGVALIAAAEGVYYQAATGDFLRRYHLVSAFFSGSETFIKDLTSFPKNMFHLDDYWRFDREKLYYPCGFFFYAVVPALIALLSTRFRKVWPVALWGLFLFFYHQFGSMSLTKYVLIHRLVRHLTIITVPSLLVLSYALTELWSSSGGSRARIVAVKGSVITVVAFLSLSSLWAAGLTNKECRAMNYDTVACYRVVKKYPSLNVYTDLSPMMHMWLLDGYRNINRFRFTGRITPDAQGGPVIVILDSVPACVEQPDEYNRLIPAPFRSAGPGWTLIEEVKGPEYGRWACCNPRIYLVETSR